MNSSFQLSDEKDRGKKSEVSSIEYRISNIQYRASSIQYRVSSIEYPASAFSLLDALNGFPLFVVFNLLSQLFG